MARTRSVGHSSNLVVFPTPHSEPLDDPAPTVGAARRNTGPDFNAMSSEEIEPYVSAATFESPEYEFYCRARSRARARELDERINALPAGSRVSASACAEFLSLTNTAIYLRIYDGRLAGTKQPRGLRGFVWMVLVDDLKRLREDEGTRIARDRAWMQEPASGHTATLIPGDGATERRLLKARKVAARDADFRATLKWWLNLYYEHQRGRLPGDAAQFAREVPCPTTFEEGAEVGRVLRDRASDAWQRAADAWRRESAKRDAILEQKINGPAGPTLGV